MTEIMHLNNIENTAQPLGGISGVAARAAKGLGVLGGRLSGLRASVERVFVPITAPRIPCLAQGAVLPAGKPFLAMVGDQRHGTNIEAPLATIQEAVALVLQDQTDAIAAGLSASVGGQREILEAVLGIRIGDETIASAYDRYRSRAAVMKGASHAI